jgi:3-deoxy-D-manno-octulosonic-acid transferase
MPSADVAFVGGGFHRAGLHSVLEPAAFGAPVVFGPRHANSREAGLLLAAHAARAPASTETLAATLIGWLAEPTARRRAGSHAREFVEHGLGAAERSFALVAELLDKGGSWRMRDAVSCERRALGSPGRLSSSAPRSRRRAALSCGL